MIPAGSPYRTWPRWSSQTRALSSHVTQVVIERRALLNRPEAMRTLVEAWRKADHWMVGRFVLMPDHLHMFCAPGRIHSTPLKKWMAFWRADVTRHWPWPREKPIWQKDFFDRQLRSGESYTQKWHYLRENPLRAGLVSEIKAWLWQGEVHPIQWHEPG